MEAFFAQHDAQNRALINRHFSQKRRQPLHHVKHLSKGVAGLLIIITLLSNAAFALTSKKRIYFNRLVVEEHEEYTSLNFRPKRDALDVGVEHGFPIPEAQEGELDVPEGWEGTYFPSIIPDGLMVCDILVSAFENCVTYSLPDESIHQFEYSEIDSEGGGMNIDSENCKKETVYIYGCEGTILTKKDRVMIYWYDGKTLFMFTTYGYTVDQAKVYAESLRKIK